MFTKRIHVLGELFGAVLLLLFMAGPLSAHAVPYVTDFVAGNVDSVAVRHVSRADSLSASYSIRRSFNENFSFMGLPLIASGLITKNQSRQFRNMRNHFNPHFHNRTDDYLQYVPLVGAWGMKAFGVKGRSDWKEFVTANALSALIMGGTVNALKYTVKEKRPDNSSSNSFPSGHTATAFMGAAILHHEYGHISPWISIGGFTLAGVTGVMRQLNNRHWVSDILAGAGIGITSVELGYFLTDIIFKHKTKVSDRKKMYWDVSPSFLAFDFGVKIGNKYLTSVNLYDKPDGGNIMDMKLRLGVNTMLGVEGAYFLNDYLGFGAKLRIGTLPLVADVSEESLVNFHPDAYRFQDAPVMMYQLEDFSSSHLGTLDTDFGVYLSYPLGNRLRLMGKCLVGRRWNAGFNINATARINPDIFDRNKVSSQDYASYYEKDVAYHMQQQAIPAGGEQQLVYSGINYPGFLKIGNSSSMKLNTGISLMYKIRERTAVRLFCEYDYTALKLKLEQCLSCVNPEYGGGSFVYYQKTPMHEFTFGSSIMFLF